MTFFFRKDKTFFFAKESNKKKMETPVVVSENPKVNSESQRFLAKAGNIVKMGRWTAEKAVVWMTAKIGGFRSTHQHLAVILMIGLMFISGMLTLYGIITTKMAMTYIFFIVIFSLFAMAAIIHYIGPQLLLHPVWSAIKATQVNILKFSSDSDDMKKDVVTGSIARATLDGVIYPRLLDVLSPVLGGNGLRYHVTIGVIITIANWLEVIIAFLAAGLATGDAACQSFGVAIWGPVLWTGLDLIPLWIAAGLLWLVFVLMLIGAIYSGICVALANQHHEKMVYNPESFIAGTFKAKIYEDDPDISNEENAILRKKHEKDQDKLEEEFNRKQNEAREAHRKNFENEVRKAEKIQQDSQRLVLTSSRRPIQGDGMKRPVNS